MLNFHHNCLQLSFNFDNYIYVIVIKVLLPHRQKHFIQIFAFMCCLFIVCIMIGVSNKAYSDTCDCLLNEFQVTPLHKQLQEHTSNWEYIRLSSGYVVAVSVTASWRSHLSICVCVCVYRLLQDHHSVQPCSDCSAVCWLFHSPLPAYRRKSSPYRRYTMCAERRNWLLVLLKYT